MTTTNLESFRRPCGPYQRLVPPEQLKTAIEQHLQAGPRIMHALARLVGYSESVVRVRLLELEEQLRAHRVSVSAARIGGRHWEWRIGPAPIADVDHDEADDADAPRQGSTRHYPPINRRDDLVAALFGPARQEAA